MRLLLPALLLILLQSTPTWAVKQYGYRVIDSKPASRDNYVQGLEIVDGQLYVSTGLHGQSRLRRYDFASGELLQQRRLNARLFAEGLTVFGDTIYQLTYRSRMMLVWDKANLELQRWFPIPGEGWGLTHDGEQLIYGDGSEYLYFLEPESGRIVHSLRVTENGRPVTHLNELEWIDGKVWANVWQQDRIVVIDPDSGEVTANIDLRGLLPAAEQRRVTDATNDVLNGIARDPATGNIWVTGKRWPKLYHIELVPLASPPSSTETR